jgi:aryl-alcohol dehydrogenase-like predicted oxidoreductase
MPVVEKLRSGGKFRFLGITESGSRDRSHKMLEMALEDEIFDTIMVAYGPTNKAAEENILPVARKKEVGVICMRPAREIARLLQTGGNNITGLSKENIEMFRLRHAQNTGHPVTAPWEVSNPAFAYKYSISHPAVSTVLTGTTNIEHLVNNALAVLGKS